MDSLGEVAWKVIGSEFGSMAPSLAEQMACVLWSEVVLLSLGDEARR